MDQILLILVYYFSILFSIIGFGNIFSKIFKRSLSLSEIGFCGLLTLILISYITNFFISHGILHNSILLILGLISFIFYFFDKSFNKKLFVIAIVIFILLFIGILMYKNHDDFFYYHFPYTLSLIETKKIIGIGHLEHGFRTPSSIFYLNSLFYLPITKLYLINIGAIYFMGFANVFFIEKFLVFFKEKKTDFIIFLTVLSFMTINTAFYRIAEHGNDRSALILIFVLVIVYYESIKYFKINHTVKIVHSYEMLIVLTLLIISLKSFYLIYLIIIFAWLIQFRKSLLKNNLLFPLLINRYNYLFIISVFIFVGTVFLNSSCLVYPASFTCFESVSWSIPKTEVEYMKDWYSLWAKAGANPNFRTSDPAKYLEYFNWVSTWIDKYFFTKVTDYLAVIFLISIISFISFKNKKNKNNKKPFDYKFLYIFIIILFIEWFLNHPTLRYGGYTVVALILYIPLSSLLDLYSVYTKKIKSLVFLMLIISSGIFVFKNVKRINNEFVKYNYNPFINPYFHIVDNAYEFSDRISKFDQLRIQNNKNYIILTKD